MRLVTGSMSCMGNTRKTNQDAVVLRCTQLEGQYFMVLAVCDGIGGLEQGEAASSMTVQRISQWYDGILEWLDMETADGEILNAHLKDLAEDCNRLVKRYQELHRVNTGTTMSLLMIIRDRFYIVQVGDSRIYRYRKGGLEQLTRDDSVTRMKNGRIRLYLDNYIGKQETLWFTCTGGILQEEDILLVCSDGLYHYLQPEDLRQVEKNIRRQKKIEAACRQLIDRMLDRGERDNITIGLVAVL